MEIALSNPIFYWIAALTIGIPLLVFILSEITERCHRRGSTYEHSFDTLRKIFLPSLTLALITTFVLKLAETNPFQRLILTILCFTSMFTVLAFVGAIKGNERDKSRWESRLPAITKTVARALAIILPFALVITAVWDLDLSKFITAIGIGSVAIAFALQNTLSSVVSGILLALDKPFKEGDWIEVNGNTGKVLDLNWRTTRLEVDGRDVVIIPNTALLDSEMKNYSVLDEGYRDSISFGFAYQDLPNKVKDVALQVAKESHHVASHPLPEVHTMSFDDSSIGYEMFFHIDQFESAFQARRIREDLMTRIYYAAAREGLEIPFPIRTLRKTGEGDLTPADVSNMALAALKNHAVLQLAAEPILQKLAMYARHVSYGRGTPISEIGQYEHGLYLILDGQVSLEDAKGHSHSKESVGGLIGARYMVGRRANQLRSVAASDVEALFFPADALDEAMGDDLSLARALHRFADNKIDDLNRSAVRLGRTEN